MSGFSQSGAWNFRLKPLRGDRYAWLELYHT
jgi:hypothetical protein